MLCLCLWCDNLSIGVLTTNLILHASTKHVELDMHFMHEKILTREFLVHHIFWKEQSTNCLIEPLFVQLFVKLRYKLNIIQQLLSLKGDDKRVQTLTKLVCIITQVVSTYDF